MAKIPASSGAAAFDAMLSRNRERLDSLYHGTAARSPEPSATPAAAPDTGGSEAARQLNARFGDGWHHEITERRRDGNEVIVLCKLHVHEGDRVRAQFGRADLGSRTARSGGLSFAIGGIGDDDSEQTAYRRAAEQALAKCLAML